MTTDEKSVAIIPAAFVPVALPEKTKDLTPIQRGWLQFCDLREVTFRSLLRGELEIQNLCNSVTATTPLPEIQETLRKVKALAAERQAERLAFTNKLKERVIEPSMEFEQRNNVLIAALTKTELDARTIAEEENRKTNELSVEKEKYKAHVVNENLRIKTTYCTTLERRIAFHYTQALTSGKKMSKKELTQHYTDIKNELAQIELEKPVRFDRKHVTAEMAKEILATVIMYNPAADLLEYQNRVEPAFAMYDQDFKNPEAAVVATNNAVEQATHQIEEAVEVEIMTNNLVASADTFTMTGGPVVKRKMVVVVENTPEWSMSVLANFIRLFNIAAPKLQVKTWEKLTLGQMCGAFNKLIAENDKLVLTGLQLKQEVK